MLSKSLQTFLGIGDAEAQKIDTALRYIFGEDAAGIDEHILKNPNAIAKLRDFLEERRDALASRDAKRIQQLAHRDSARLQEILTL